METCIGCGAEQEQFGIIAVVNENDTHGVAPVVESLDNPGWKGMGVCDACHRDPAHRAVPIKAHFFERAAAKAAVVMAGSSSNIGG